MTVNDLVYTIFSLVVWDALNSCLPTFNYSRILPKAKHFKEVKELSKDWLDSFGGAFFKH